MERIRVVIRLAPGAQPAQQRNLDVIHWVDIRVAHPDRTLQPRFIVQKIALPGQVQDGLFGALELAAQSREYRVACVALGQPE